MKDKNTNCHIERNEISKKPHCHTEGVARSISKKKIFRFLRKLNMTREILCYAYASLRMTMFLKKICGYF